MSLSMALFRVENLVYRISIIYSTKYTAGGQKAKLPAYPSTAVTEKLNIAFIDLDQNQRGGMASRYAKIP